MDALSDRELLAAFARHADQRAFEAVVRRHEALVLNVCRRVLGDEQEAQDAGQAVFLALARKGARLDLDRPLAPWLHHVSTCVALNARQARETRRAREREKVMMHTAGDESWKELRPLLDRALDKLPDRYRRPLVLFHLEGKSLEETARALGSSPGTVGAQLSRGREMLRSKLAPLTALGMGALLAALAREAGAASGFAAATARAAAGGAVPAQVTSLMEGALNMLFWMKLKAAALGASGIAIALTAGVLLTGGSRPESRTAPAPMIATVEPVFSSLRPFEADELEAEPGPSRSSDLVAHWKLDEKEGAAAADASGRNYGGKTVGTPSWAAGKHGGALKLDGKGGHVEMPSNDDLDKVQQGNYSLSAWFHPEDVPPGTESDNNESYGIIVKAGWHLGLQYNHAQQFIMTHWLEGAEPEWKGAGTWEDTYGPGQWHHVVGVVDRAAGKVQIFVNGELKNEGEFTANAAPRDYEKQPWRIGIGSPGAEKWSWPAKGMIDDVRIYNRALSPLDVKGLFESK